MSYKEKIQSEILKAIETFPAEGEARSPHFASEAGQRRHEMPLLERPKFKEHGDVATNIAMVLAKVQKRNPIDIANEIKEKIKINTNLISHIEVAKPGFINFVVSDYVLAESICEIHKSGETFGFAKPKSKEKILVEYVSANPTGDLHIGHGRQAVIGSCLVNLLSAAGYDVASEFYINDYGEQIQNLSDTAWVIYKKLQGETIEWKEDFYPEEIVLPYVQKIVETYQGKSLDDITLPEKVKHLILDSQKELLSSLKVDFNKWFSETSIHESGAVKDALEKLEKRGFVYESEGATWFKAKEFGDVRDRVLVRKDQRTTYLLADIAYHIDKFERSNFLITIWGADHHGQEVSLKGGLKALGFDDTKLEIIFVQLVSLKKEGQEIKMSKRAGTVVTIEEVLNDVGPDAFRYFLIENHPNTRMIFDIDLARKQDKDNPVYYIQYAHARCCSIFRQVGALPAKGEARQEPHATPLHPDLFMNLFRANNEEYAVTKNLILKLLDFPEEVEQSAVSRSPNRIANYLKDLATDFHQFYTFCRVITKDEKLTNARLGLAQATKITIANGLKILGISAPESM